MISNMVVTTRLSSLNLQMIESSSKDIFYEAELFPAALIRKWEPAHIALFHNGKIVITGVKSIPHCHSIIKAILDYFVQK